MRKLIAYLLCILIILSFNLTTFANSSTSGAVNVDNIISAAKAAKGRYKYNGSSDTGWIVKLYIA